MDQSPDVTMESDQNNNYENSSNNNLSIKKNEKYSLRQRGQRKSIVNKQAKAESGSRSKANINNSTNDEFTASTTVKDKVAKEKPKQRAAPLSKYRRKTANARERTRMREINHAFETLRQSVPVIIAGSQTQCTNEKLTKITTLRMAMKYIKILSDILDNKTEVSDSLLSSLMEYETNNDEEDKPTVPLPSEKVVNVNSKSNRNREKLSAPSGNILAQNHHDYCKEVNRESIVKPVKPTKVTLKKSVKASSVKTKKPPSKVHSKVQKNLVKHQPLAPPIISRNQTQIHQSLSHHETKFINHLLGGSFNHTMLHNNNMNNNSLNCLSKYDLSPCLTPPNDDSPADLGLILESDGESLQLSEPCFSPLELGLLLESDGESLHLSEPCLSPLNHLDALNSFNDLIHAGFNEHNSLEMYLS